MFKTIRKGDASLQYTILPQTDQFFGNAPPLQPPDTRQPIMYKLIIPSIFMLISICFFSILGISVLLIMMRHEADPFNVPELKEVRTMVQMKSNVPTTKINSMDVKEAELISTDVPLETNSIIETTIDSIVPKTLQTSPSGEVNVPEAMDTVTDFTSPENKLLLTEIGIGSPPPEDLKSSENSEVPVTVLPSTTIDTALSSISSNPRTTVLNDLMTNAMSSTSIFKRAKMPRVTLKLRENDTIPQMYMKAGIASYKKGNITTSVLAHGLSLEGLIFKTPEGTIKPWSKKCAFTDSALYARLKRYCEKGGRIFALGLSLGAVLSMVCSIIVLAKFKNYPVRWSNVEEPPLNRKDDEEQEDRSKLLEPETKLIDEKE